jgi:hypothetical protein
MSLAATMIPFPPVPTLPPEQCASGEARLRYEDLSQDGRPVLPAVLQACAPTVWGKLLGAEQALRPLRERGIVPILARLVLEGHPGPFGVAHPFAVKGGYQLAHAASGNEVERLLILTWGEISGPRGRILGPPPPGAGEMAPFGRMFAENVLTRLFAPPEQRRVLRFDVPGLPAVPEHRHPIRPNETIIALPEGAVPLEPTFAPDSCPLVFGVCHTDANQHVNSLVYPRLFEEAALRRFAALGVSAPGLARSAELGFRKPCFAGDRARVLLQAFTLEGRHGAVGVVMAEGDLAAPEQARPHCYAQMLFEP